MRGEFEDVADDSECIKFLERIRPMREDQVGDRLRSSVLSVFIFMTDSFI